MNDLLSWRDYFPNDLTLRNTFDHGTNIASGQGLEIRDLGVPEHPLFLDESWRKKRGGRTIHRDNVGIAAKNRSVFTRLPFLLERRMISLNLNPVVIDAKRIISASSPPFSTNLRNPIPLTIQQRSRSNQFEA